MQEGADGQVESPLDAVPEPVRHWRHGGLQVSLQLVELAMVMVTLGHLRL